MEEPTLYLNFGKDLFKLSTEQIVAPYDINPDRIISGSSLSTLNQAIGLLYSGKLGFTNTETGYILGNDAGTQKLYIGNSSNYLNWTGSSLVISGNITATSGTIGGWTIGATTLTGTNSDITLDSANKKISVVSGGTGSIEISNANDIAFLVSNIFNASIRLRTGIGGSTYPKEMAFAVGSNSTDFEVSLEATAADNGNFSPIGSGTQDLGTTSKRWDTIYLINSPDVSSDKILKKNILPVKYGLADIMKLEPIEYEWKKGKAGKHIGFIAQDIEKIMPEIASKCSYKPMELIPILIKSIQELTSRVEILELQ